MVTDEMIRVALLAFQSGDMDWSSQDEELMRFALEEALSAMPKPKPVSHLVWLQGRRAADDVEDYYEVARPGDKCVDGSDPFPVYAAPPAPSVAVKALHTINLIVGNVEHEGGGANSARMYAGMLNDIRAVVLSALSAQVQDARSDDDEETYQIGVRDGYSQAVQEVDQLTGGDGEYRYCTDNDPERHTPGPAEMIQRIVDRFETLNLIGDAEKRGDFWDAPGSAQVQDVAIPEGWQLVPIDRTPEMIEAGTLDSPYGVSNKAWSDMLAAAPAKQEG